MNKLKRELLNAEIINRAVESDKIIKAIKEIESCGLNNKPTMEDVVGVNHACELGEI